MIMRWEEDEICNINFNSYDRFFSHLSSFVRCLLIRPRWLRPAHLESQAELSEGAPDLLCEEVHALTLLQRHHLVRSPLLRLPQQLGHVELFRELLHDLLQHRSHLVIN